MKNKISSILLFFISAVFFSSCIKKGTEQPNGGEAGLTVPDGFLWETSRNVTFNISMNDDRFGTNYHSVEIFSGNPYQGGKLLSKGSFSMQNAFRSTIYLADTLREVYVLKTAPDLSTLLQKVVLNSKTISLSMGNTTETAVSASKSRGVRVAAVSEVSPDCNTGCTSTITSNNTNLNVNDGQVICVTGSNITIGFNANGGTVRICGTNVTVQNANLSNSSKLIIANSASVVFSNLNLNGSAAKVVNFGTASVNGSFSPNGVFENAGRFSTTGDFNLNSGASFVNDGVITVGSNMNVSNPSSTNNSSITVEGSFQLNSNTVFTNNCTLWAKTNCIINSVMHNYRLIKTGSQTVVNGSSFLKLYNNAMLTTGSMMLNGTVDGSGLTSLVKVSGNSTINGGAKVTGAVQYCDQNGIETNSGSFENGAAQGCSVYIPTSGCNSEGNGSPAIIDADNDGVADNLDEYPNDPSKAYNNYYPSALASDRGSIAFEDNWPRKGDYDFNDIVVSYRYKIVTSAQNKVVQVNGDYTLYATGGTSGNGFAVAFPVSRASAKNFTGGTLETGQDSAVAVVFSDMRSEMSAWNTIPGMATVGSKNYKISFDLDNGPSLNSFGLGVYNPFSWNGAYGLGRAYEIHLPGRRPTKLAGASNFGQSDDATNPGTNKYYLTADNLPWAINIPVSQFDYPKEQAHIAAAYLKFQDWTQSGGLQYVDWYLNKSAYRNSSYIYVQP